MMKNDVSTNEDEKSEVKNMEDSAIGENPTSEATDADGSKSINALLNVKLDIRVVLGRRRMPISELLELTRGSVVELDRKVGDPVDIMINDRLVAQGELVKVPGDYIGVALREIIKDFIPST